MTRAAILAFAALALATPAQSIPPPLPPADQFDFNVGDTRIRCRLPEPAGHLQDCIMQYSSYLLSVRIIRQSGERYFYYIDRSCLEPSYATGGFGFIHRNGQIPDGEIVRGSQAERDLREILALRTDESCESIANWPHEIDTIVRQVDRGLAVLRSIKYEELSN